MKTGKTTSKFGPRTQKSTKKTVKTTSKVRPNYEQGGQKIDKIPTRGVFWKNEIHEGQ